VGLAGLGVNTSGLAQIRMGNETELASLVCDKFGDDTCINPAKGTTKGDGWEKRLNSMQEIEKDISRANE